MNYKNLCTTPVEDIHKAFTLAFSDYEVPLNITLQAFEAFLTRRGYNPSFSVGAFEDDKLVGFILNGLRSWNNILTVYDTGTGVIPEYRKRGITTMMLQLINETLVERNITCYLLEVIKTNKPAFDLYKKHGFEITRELSCFQTEKNNLKLQSSYQLKHMKPNEMPWDNIIRFWDFTPTWQNSIDSILSSSPNSLHYSTVMLEDEVIGYGIIDVNNGNIPQLAVHKAYRNQGVGRSLLNDMLLNTKSEKLSLTNVDNSCKSMLSVLYHYDFQYTVGQYEMMKSIKTNSEDKS